VDAEGCFYIRLAKDKQYRTGWFIQACFQIQLHSKDKDLLLLIKSYFNEIGTIYNQKNRNLSIYQVRDFSSIINVIIPHFDKYPLLTRKHNDFIMFKAIVEIVQNKEHLCNKGLLRIVSLKGSLNKGLSENLKESFPNVIIAKKHIVKIPDKLNYN
jgi:hypothetical protein